MYGPGCRVRMVIRPTINQGLVNSFLGDAARRKTSRLVPQAAQRFGLCTGFSTAPRVPPLPCLRPCGCTVIAAKVIWL